MIRGFDPDQFYNEPSKCWIRFLPITVAVILLLVLFSCFIFGCECFQPIPEPPVLPPVLPSPDIITVYRIDWIMSLSILIIGFGAFIFFMGNQLGIKLVAAAMVVIIALLALTKYALWFAIFGLIGTIGLFAYTIWTSKKTHFNLNTALQEVVTSIENFKGISSIDTTIKRDLKDIFNVYQSNTTKQIVEKIKNGDTK